MRHLISLLVFSLLFLSASAQQRLISDTSHLQRRAFSRARISRYKADPAFQYEKGFEGPKSDWRRFWDWVREKLGRWFGIEGTGLYYFLFAAVIGILLILIFNLRGLNRSGLLARYNPEGGFGYRAGEENIHEISFDEEIEKAIHSKNFRMAVRLLYLQTLMGLAGKGIIKWQTNKTNSAYLDELNGSVYRQSFGDLTLQFELNWYGGLAIGEKEFAALAYRFQSFKKELSQA
jgi:hypothetical protein